MPSAETSFRYVPQPARCLIEMFGRSIGGGSAAAMCQRRDYTFEHVRHFHLGRLHHPGCEAGGDRRQEVGLVDTASSPTVSGAPRQGEGQVDVDLDMLHGKQPA